MQMLKWGIAAGTHDGSLAVVEDNNILFASHSERYSRKKNDPHLNSDLIQKALESVSYTHLRAHET